jgi:uncharacterized membrane protein
MVPDPLHPAVVHFPIVLMFLVPITAVAAIVAIRRGWTVPRAWSVVVAIAAALSVSSWVAVQTGESQEDRIEHAVSHAAMEAHEEPAERFLLFTGMLALLTTGGLVPGVAGRLVRSASVLASIGVLAAGALVGHTGGELAYRHGAAAAYSAAGHQTDTLGARAAAPEEMDEDARHGSRSD